MKVENTFWSGTESGEKKGIASLLGYSFMLTFGKASTLPFITVYLSRALSMAVTEVGLVLSFALALGTVATLVGGYLIDRFSPKPVLIATGLARHPHQACVDSW